MPEIIKALQLVLFSHQNIVLNYVFVARTYSFHVANVVKKSRSRLTFEIDGGKRSFLTSLSILTQICGVQRADGFLPFLHSDWRTAEIGLHICIRIAQFQGVFASFILFDWLKYLQTNSSIKMIFITFNSVCFWEISGQCSCRRITPYFSDLDRFQCNL